MTPARMAAIHALSFTVPRPWSEGEFREMTGDTAILRAFADTDGFGLVRAVAGEAELLTLAVDPLARCLGIGSRLLVDLLEQTTPQAAVIFLEVARNNTPAIRLYERHGFRRAGTRPAYYDATTDALIYRRELR
ncbi:MAG: GNAT family N-acetyltransferase [Deltaproteobacteria bacterium]